MTVESETAGAWAGLIGLACFIAITGVAGYWIGLCAVEAQIMQAYSEEPYTLFDALREDIPRSVPRGPVTAAEKAEAKMRALKSGFPLQP